MDGQENEQDPEGAPPPGSPPADRFGPDFVREEWELEGPAVCISLGDAADLDPALLAAVNPGKSDEVAGAWPPSVAAAPGGSCGP
jgi:hypothetical protein